MFHGWTPQIGDPSYVGWITVFAYFGSSVLCFRAGGRDRDSRQLWYVLGFWLAFLGVNKQLDLQTLLTDVARDYARTEGWYERRRFVQRLFVTGIGLMAVGCALLVIWILRRRPRAIQAAYAGLVLLMAFIFIRAASFHHVDGYLRSTLLGAHFNWILELGGVTIIAIASATVAPSRQETELEQTDF